MATVQGFRFDTWEVYDTYEYPNGFQEVLEGRAYWQTTPLQILGHYGKFDMLGGYLPDVKMHWVERRIDMEHPRCYYCGKFVKKGDWWEYGYIKRTGPCLNCDEDIDW